MINFSKKVRVLIADDVQETRRSTRLMIAELEYAEVVAIASNGRQAVEMTDEQHPDIVILDVNMPEMDGLTAFQRIAQAHPDVGGIIISAERHPAIVNTASALGIQEYLTKPFFVEELDGAIRRVMAQLQKKRQRLVPSKMEGGETSLEALANEYVKDGRTDNQAMDVFERLAADPKCAPGWLKTLAIAYAIRGDWGKLKTLAARLEQESASKK